MANERIFLLSNLSAEIFYDLAVPAGADVMAAAKAQLRAAQLPAQVQQGFFVSVFPTDTPPDAATPDVSLTPDAATPNRSGQAPEKVSALDAAAAQGPLQWSDDDAPAASGEDPERAALVEQLPAAVMPLGSAGGH